jgi:hypothetical protein
MRGMFWLSVEGIGCMCVGYGMSHNLRLLAPFVLAAVLLSTLLLAVRVHRAALVCQILFYGLAILGIAQRGNGPFMRMTEAAFTLLTLNAVAVFAFANFVTGGKQALIR